MICKLASDSTMKDISKHGICWQHNAIKQFFVLILNNIKHVVKQLFIQNRQTVRLNVLIKISWKKCIVKVMFTVHYIFYTPSQLGSLVKQVASLNN